MRSCLLLALSFFLFNCQNYWGNPYKTPLPPRMVPVSHDSLRVEPANWWAGMKWNKVEILFQRAGLGEYEVRLLHANGLKILKVEKGDSPNYLFVTLEIKEKAPAQKVEFVFSKGKATFTHEYPIRARNSATKAQGVTPKDVIYLIFPDRFANGDPSNDNISGMLQGLQRDKEEGRHGGDLKGIQQHLDYLQDLGISTIWLNPELENDQIDASYHGYAVTDHYRVDRRFGANTDLRDLITECHRRGMKVVRDVVLNHIGDNHWWMKDLPTKDWVNQWPTYTNTTFRAPTMVDPYASEYDKKHFSDGWFDKRMPDLNQRNPHVSNYLIQQAIWWIEYAGIDDFRIDTYTYADQTFCSKWCQTLREEYPNLSMFGEIWENAVPIQGYFADDQPITRPHFDSNLPGVVDFQLCFAIQEALTKETGWTEGASRIYYVLAQDCFYKNPYKNVTMLDNHDMTRFYTQVGQNMDKYKTGLAFLLTMRGTPQIYYATEILSTGGGSPTWGSFRKEFLGGWAGDPSNKFTPAGRSAEENEAFNFVRTLTRYRNETPALQTGKLMQFAPYDRGA
ncbi:MAG: cyclomaltodextrinase N-terminal domain-containing protein, partial [Phycisphaerae bacterium]|nr:cyclomaltodextrinase N-terminal domain-containing protein [Saprospiraceae bacterium]